MITETTHGMNNIKVSSNKEPSTFVNTHIYQATAFIFAVHVANYFNTNGTIELEKKCVRSK